MALETGPKGLSTAQAARRRAENGPNALREDKPLRPWMIFLAQFRGLIVWILVAAGILAGLLGEGLDCAAILAIVALNAALGFHQEFHAEKSIAALRGMTAPQAKVWRDGSVSIVAAADLVAGDVIELEAGDRVAADARLLEASLLQCIEGALTGEAEAVDKHAEALEGPDLPLGDRRNMVFMGTGVAAGQGRAVVVATAMNTEVGRIAGLIKGMQGRDDTPLQQKIAALGRVLVWSSLGLVTLLFVLGLLRGMPFFELFMTSVSLAIAAVPEGLPVILTVALSMGVLRMARRRVLVRRLPAVETLGSTTVICTDKTGTLTVGEMTLRTLYVAGRTFAVTGEGYAPRGEVLPEGGGADKGDAKLLLALAEVLVGCNNAHLVLEQGLWRVIGDPTEGALLAGGQKAGGDRERLEREWPKHHEMPFDSDRKRRTVVRLMPDGRLRALTNGAPDLLLNHCTRILDVSGVRPITGADRAAIAERNAALAGQALRVLGSAYRDLEAAPPGRLASAEVERDLVFVGLSGMQDPPRAEARAAVAKCRIAGIRVVMITGDHPHTAMAVARELGIADADDAALSGAELDGLDDTALRAMAPGVAVYARVTAAHKLRIVRAWQANGAVVAMTGDGVNDAPALKGADIGIAMGRGGTEVARQASAMVITDDNFASIVAAVEEGRGIYDNIRKTLAYLLAGNCGELILMAVCLAAFLPMPLLPIHLLWLNFASDGLIALCLAADPIDPGVMRQRPRRRLERITNRGFLGRMLLSGVLTAAVALGVYLHVLKTESLEMARTQAFAALVFAELFKSFSFRSETLPVWRLRFLDNMPLLATVVLVAGFQVWSQHNETMGRILKIGNLATSDSVMLLAVSLIPLAVLEAVKWMRARAG